MVIESFKEFCYTLWYDVPKAYYFYKSGKEIETKGKIGTDKIFYFSKKHTEEKKHDWNRPNITCEEPQPFYTKENFCLSNDKEWLPPPYKEVFKNDIFIYEKPILTVNNKTTKEWGGRYNYLDLEYIKKIIKIFGDNYQIVYIKPPIGESNRYQQDPVGYFDIKEYEFFEKHHPEIVYSQKLMQEYPDKSFNEIQMMLLANSEHHIATAGGEAAIASYFGGDLFIYRHPNCQSSNRGVWKTDSYLKRFSNISIFGYDDKELLLQESKKRWIN